jgi:hypothetical protein
MVGDQESAIEQLQVVLSVPSIYSPAFIELDPRWDTLRSNPGFQALVEPQ